MSKTGNITFTIIKPGAVSNEHIGDILQKVTNAGFWIAAMKYIKLSNKQAEEFYRVHSERPFYNDLVKFMTSGPIVVAVLEKDNAVDDYRKLIGATDPSKAEEGTIRKLFAESIERNAVHGSDSNDNAIIESNFFFSRSERFTKDGDFLTFSPCGC
ncbi:MAG: nucleoside-diphosphate kinase [Bacteroidetes bacterium]|jgi:nucleoside-diphosphate kinase|nr:nucleoside-diphosphate kinase [Bacteroidota bacterium]MBT3750671.1 nucleoside-diphosphate kinase [Bacteroidota bacterium]MBT4399144.1 nucleoside-diphosphate kinase [Bacteroidota bacterium]MBT4409395.1 nucleoside-diphosphate kinase [Bacteroidota bacterium]MBT7092508.1 nucleoside-diphosphate kinase [Bacteroidota bacterium]